jgi:hypothetical protein
VSTDDVHAAWAGLDLQTQRAVIDTVCTVTINPLGKGRMFDL